MEIGAKHRVLVIFVAVDRSYKAWYVVLLRVMPVVEVAGQANASIGEACHSSLPLDWRQPQ
jgi:hypothetical protein